MSLVLHVIACLGTLLVCEQKPWLKPILACFDLWRKDVSKRYMTISGRGVIGIQKVV